jgi:hypothetical protein
VVLGQKVTLQLRVCLCFLEDRFHACGLHNVSLHLELPRHEELLCVCLSGNQFTKVRFREDQSYYGSISYISFITTRADILNLKNLD